MNGTDALAAALRTCADRFYGIPGYPVTEIARILGAGITVNEKVALEYALGDSLAGRRAAVVIKNVGLNACADPLVNATTQGLNAGVVIVAGDDCTAQGSQNTQDSRYYGELAQVPVLEPDRETCTDAVDAAFEASERFSRVAILRVTPALLEREAAGTTEILGRVRGSGALASPDLTMQGRAQAAERVTTEMFAWSKNSPLNRLSGGTVAAGAATGQSRVVTVYPPPAGADLLATSEFCRPFLRDHRCLVPPETVAAPETYHDRGFYRTFCRGCPFKPLMGMLAKRKIPVICDIGCALLAMNQPYRIGKAGYALGSSVAVAARSTKVALTGDYAFMHSGMNALTDVYEKQLPLLTIVLKNDRMGMTGGQKTGSLLKYIAWAEPVILCADDERLEHELVIPDAPRTLVVTGTCPEGCSHETMEC